MPFLTGTDTLGVHGTFLLTSDRSRQPPLGMGSGCRRRARQSPIVTCERINCRLPLARGCDLCSFARCHRIDLPKHVLLLGRGCERSNYPACCLWRGAGASQGSSSPQPQIIDFIRSLGADMDAPGSVPPITDANIVVVGDRHCTCSPQPLRPGARLVPNVVHVVHAPLEVMLADLLRV